MKLVEEQYKQDLQIKNKVEDEEEKQGVLTCSICAVLYDIHDKKPVVLLCGHTFCKKCISADHLKNKVIRCFNRCDFGGHIYKSVDNIGVNIELLNQIDTASKTIRKQEKVNNEFLNKLDAASKI